MRAQLSVAQTVELRGLYHDLGTEACFAAAKSNQVEAMVGTGLGQTMGSSALPPAWAALLDDNAKRVKELIAALSEVCAALQTSGCAAAATEAGGVMLATSLPPAAFGSGDIDLLVDERDWRQTQEIFRRAGFVAAQRRDKQTKRLEYARPGDSGAQLWIEVGFAPFDRIWTPLHCADRNRHWLDQRRPSGKDRHISVLAPAHALAFVAMHTSLHSYVRAPGLRLHADVDRLVAAGLDDDTWREFVDEVEAMGVRRRVFVSLLMARGLLNTPIPSAVLEALSPGKSIWRLLRSLLEDDHLFVSGRHHVGPAQVILLDMLLDERSPIAWFRDAAWPPSAWLREHFGRHHQETPAWRLQGQRYRQMLRRWRPR